MSNDTPDPHEDAPRPDPTAPPEAPEVTESIPLAQPPTQALPAWEPPYPAAPSAQTPPPPVPYPYGPDAPPYAAPPPPSTPPPTPTYAAPPPPLQQPAGPPPAYGQPSHPSPYGAPGYGVPPVQAGAPSPTNTSALVLTIIAGLLTVSCYFSIIGIAPLVLGIVALSKQTTDWEGSRRMARIGWITMAAVAVGVTVLAIGFIALSLAAGRGY